MSCREVRHDVVACIGRRQDIRLGQIYAGNQEEEDEEEGTYDAPGFQFWGGATDPHEMDD